MGINIFIHNGINAAFFEGLERKLIAVEGFAFESEENESGGTGARVGGDTCGIEVDFVELIDVHETEMLDFMQNYEKNASFFVTLCYELGKVIQFERSWSFIFTFASMRDGDFERYAGLVLCGEPCENFR